MKCNKCSKESKSVVYKDSNEINKLICSTCYKKNRQFEKNPNYKSRRQEINERICSNCGSDKTRIAYSYGSPYLRWISDKKGGHICAKCYDKLTNTKEKQKKKNENRIKYKGEYIRIKGFKKQGQCSWCKNNIYNKSCKETQMHHFKYNDHDKIKDTLELCSSCHSKVTRENVKEELILLKFTISEQQKEINRLKLLLSNK